MYRPQNESRFQESTYHEENPFFRETITIIDECTKLMKEDRIFLRNKVKDYLKELKENRQKEDDWENEQIQLLLQIFVEANKKKSLSKIQKGDKVMDWLQIKLRKFIDGNKKERHRKELQSFQRLKGINAKRQFDPHLNFDRSLQKSRQRAAFAGQNLVQQINKLSFNIEPKKKSTLPKYSLSKSNEKSPEQSRRKVSQRQPFAQHSNLSFYRQFDYLKRTASKDKQQNPRKNASSLLKNKLLYQDQRPLSSQLTKLNRSLDTHKPVERSIDRKAVNHNWQKANENTLKSKKGKQAQNELTKHEIDKLTELFTHHLNSQEQSKKNTSNTKHSAESHFKIPHKTAKQPREIIIPAAGRLPSEPSSERQPAIFNNSSRYEASSQKIHEMLRGSKELLTEYQHQDSFPKYPPNEALPSREITFPKSSSNEDLFTPPDFLAECRKYMFSSNKKKTEGDVLAFQTDEKYNEPYSKATFSDILNDSKQKSLQKGYKSNPFGANETVSENVSANLSVNKPDSEVHFQYRNICITNIESLLLQIFKSSHKATLDRFQLGEIMSKCNPETEQLFQKYCDVLSLQSNTYSEKLSFDFVAAVKYFYTLGKIFETDKEYFCMFLSEILDIRKKGYIDMDDIENFFESLEISELDASVLSSIHDLLSSIFKSSCEVENGNIITYWSIYYLELKKDAELLALREHLNKFEFQLDQETDQ